MLPNSSWSAVTSSSRQAGVMCREAVSGADLLSGLHHWRRSAPPLPAAAARPLPRKSREFTLSSLPSSAPFTKRLLLGAALRQTGRPVAQGQAVCIVEAMKLMNEIESDVAGEIVKYWSPTGSRSSTDSRCSDPAGNSRTLPKHVQENSDCQSRGDRPPHHLRLQRAGHQGTVAVYSEPTATRSTSALPMRPSALGRRGRAKATSIFRP